MLSTVEDLGVEIRLIAISLAKSRGSVTAPEVLEEMETRGLSTPTLGEVAGSFYDGPWKDAGLSYTGPHAQPVVVWQYGGRA